MKKKNNKGFMLTEALVVSVLITTVLIALYVHFKQVSNRVNDSLKYDSIDSMYSLNSVRSYIEQENYSAMIAGLDVFDYVDLTDCSEYYFSNKDFCKSIFDSLGIEQIIITKENLYGLLNNKTFTEDYINGSFKKYIEQIAYEKTNGYRLIASLKNETYANVKIFDGDSFLLNISNSCTSSTKKKYVISYINEEINSSLIDDYIGEFGCGLVLTVDRFISDVTDPCYEVSNIPLNSIVISEDESFNKLTIPYKRKKVNVTINYLDTNNNSIMPARVQQESCGLEFNPSVSVVPKEGYIFDHASSDVIQVQTSDIEINLYYRQGSA